jgi:mRNA interferase HigB
LASRAKWRPPDIKASYRSASFIANKCVVLNIKGNGYRLVTLVRYGQGLMCIRFVGHHHQFNKIGVTAI